MSPVMRRVQPEVSKHYLKVQVETASHGKRIAMLHEKCVELMAAARECEGMQRRFRLDKAQNILAQLLHAIDQADPVNKSLFYLYDYAYVGLESGRDDAIIASLSVVTRLRDTFRVLLVN